jgi:hypothetical protein
MGIVNFNYTKNMGLLILIEFRYWNLKKRHSEVTDIDSMKKLMGYNEQTATSPNDLELNFSQVE